MAPAVALGREIVANISLMDRPQLLLDPPALLYKKLFLLPGQIADTILYFRPPLEPTGIAVSIIIIARFPASLPVSGYARLCRRTQSAIPLVFRVLQRPSPRRCYCE
jgi:hypothetical protein